MLYCSSKCVKKYFLLLLCSETLLCWVFHEQHIEASPSCRIFKLDIGWTVPCKVDTEAPACPALCLSFLWLKGTWQAEHPGTHPASDTRQAADAVSLRKKTTGGVYPPFNAREDGAGTFTAFTKLSLKIQKEHKEYACSLLVLDLDQCPP